MRTRLIAALDLALLLPAALFMAALVVRGSGSVEVEPAHSAQQIITWYAGRMWTLWILLLALPFIVALSGGATLLSRWKPEPEFRGAARRLIAATTLAAEGILTIVVLHMGAN